MHSHLTRIHGLSPTDQIYIQAFKDVSTHEKYVSFNRDIPRSNPMFDFRNDKPYLTPKLVNALHTNLVPEKNLEDCFEDDVYEFPTFDDSNVANTKIFIPPRTNEVISEDFVNAITQFREHLWTVSGGFRSDAFSQKDFRNIIHFLNNVGEDSIFRAKDINSYLSLQLKCRSSPSTLSSRVLSLSRFIDYLKVNDAKFLPNEGELQKLTSMLTGVKISLNKLVKKRQRVVMQKNRETYGGTIQVLKEWRDKRKRLDYSSLFGRYARDDTINLTRPDYVKMRNFLIAELIIPNGQRPGVISGVTIGEMHDAKKNITDCYHKLMVSCHKTGYLQCAVLFIYPEIYGFFEIFVTTILSKLPSYISSDTLLNNKSQVFQTFNGDPIPSSRITPILRKFLSEMSINFVGTITDLRKAAATLTGKYNPELHDLMALFMCHSRVAHDKYYRVNIGHDGLVDAFKSLENFQCSSRCTSPKIFNKTIEIPTDDESTTLSQIDKNRLFSSSSRNHSPVQLTEKNSPDELNFYDEFSTNNECTSHCTTSEFSNQSIVGVEEIITSNQVRNNIIFPSSSTHSPPIQFSNIECANELSNLPSNSNSLIEQTDSRSIASRGSTSNCIGNEYFPRSISPITSASNKIVLRDFHIPLIDVVSHRKKDIAAMKPSQVKNSFFSIRNENIFLDAFSDIINKIRHKFPITRREILDTALTSSLFSPHLRILNNLFCKTDVEKRIVNKVRYIGSKLSKKEHLSQSSSQILLNVSTKTKEYISHKKRNKSIFFLRKDELLFRHIFSDLISRVTNHQRVYKHEILKRIEDMRFNDVLTRLKEVYSFDVYPKLLAKVRTVGISKRIL